MEKNILSTIMPFVPQTGKIVYVPKGVGGFPALNVRASEKNKMLITNYKSFLRMANKNVTFGGNSVTEDTKKLEITAGTTITAEDTRRRWRYVCTPNSE